MAGSAPWVGAIVRLTVVLALAACAPASPAPASGPPPAAQTTAPAPPVAEAKPAAAAAGGAPTVAPVRVATAGRPDQAALFLAIERGYFARQGLDVETVQFTVGAEMVPALATNQIQVGNGSPSAALFNALGRGVNIRMVSEFAHVGAG